MSRTVSYCCSQPLKVSPSTMEFMHVSNCLLLLLAVSLCLSGPIKLLHVFHFLFHFHGIATCFSMSLNVDGSLSHCLSGPMELLHVSHCLSLLAFSHSLSEFHGVAKCVSLSAIVACSL